MRTYEYQAILENNEQQRILWSGRATSKTEFLNSETVKTLLAEGWRVIEAHRATPETRRPRKYYSMAFVDMGQAAR